MKRQFRPLLRKTKRIDQLQMERCFFFHLFLEETVAIAPVTLGPEHGGVSASHEGFKVRAVVRIHGNTH